MIKKLGAIFIGIIATAASCSFWKPCCSENGHNHTHTHTTAPAHSSSTAPLSDSSDASKVAEVKQTVLHISSKNEFDELLTKNTKPMVVKFEAQWCGPCKKIKPLYEAIATELQEQYTFVAIDVDTAADVAHSYNVRGVPTILFIKNGKEIAQKDRIVGAFTDKADFITTINTIFTTHN